jgi:rhodanese-related sulfurtransferase
MKKTDCFSRLIIEGFKPPENSVLISISDPDSNFPKVNAGWDDILWLQFWDAIRGEGLAASLAGYDIERAPSEMDAQRIYDFICDNKDKNIYAHCEAGISRSGAVREFLERMGWEVGHPHWQIHPNQTVLSDLQMIQRELGLLDK